MSAMEITTRRSFLASALGAAGTATAREKYRVGIIGHTGHGNYGHGIDMVWRSFDQMSVVAVADANSTGRESARKRTGALRGYADYREMLRRENLDLVGVGPRWLDEREQMVIAAAEAGAHLFTEKPFARSPVEADRMIEVIAKAKVKVQVAHQMRVSPYTLRAKAMVEAGDLGDIQEVRARGKEDRRAGGEDLMVLGTHLFDMIRIFLGNPQWVTAHVTTNGAELAPPHVRQATEPIGPVAGNQISATFAFPNGVHAHFDSRATADTHPLRFGMWLYGSKGVLFLPMGIYPEGGLWLLSSPAWVPDERHQWNRVEVELDVAGQKIAAKAGSQLANALLVADLVQAVEQNRRTCCSEEDGRWTIEMVHGIYQAQKSGGRVHFPLQSRIHALEL